jgi:hypothetical protein
LLDKDTGQIVSHYTGDNEPFLESRFYLSLIQNAAFDNVGVLLSA